MTINSEKPIKGVFLELLILVALTLLTLRLSGYSFGIGDQIIHIPFLKSIMDPELYQKDDLISYMQGKPTLFWHILTPVISLVNIEVAFFALQTLSILLLLYSVHAFTLEITKNRQAAYLAMLLSMFPKFSFGYSSLIVLTHFIPRNLIIGPTILAITLYLKGYRKSTYFILGVLTNMHALTTLPVIASLIAFEAYSLVTATENIKSVKETVKKSVMHVLIFLLALTPLFVTRYELFADRNNNIEMLRNDYVQFYTSIMQPFYQPENTQGVLLLANALFLGICAIVWVYIEKSYTAKVKHFTISFCCMCLLLVMTAIVSETVIKYPFLVQLQLARAGSYTILFFTAFLSYRIVTIDKKYISRFATYVLTFIVMINPLMAVAFFIELFVQIREFKPAYAQAAKLGIILFCILSLYYLRDFRISEYKLQMYYQDTDNYVTQTWLKEYTKRTDIIISPYYIGGFTEPDFRTVSERTNILTNADIVETILNVNMLTSTREKLNDFTLGNYESLIKDKKIFDYTTSRKLYHDALEKNLENLKKKYSATYAVIEADYSLQGYNVVYANKSFKVYRL